MSVLNTFLVFVAIPVAAVLVISGLAFAGGNRTRRNRRYRPGRPYDFQPIWFLAAPERVSTTAVTGVPRGRPAIEGQILEDSSGARVLPGPTGGASDRW